MRVNDSDSKPRVKGAALKRVAAPLTTVTMEASYLSPIRSLVRSHPPPILLLLNAGVWNTLEPIADSNFDQLASAMDVLLQSVRREFPHVTTAWVGMTALHVHRASCDSRVGAMGTRVECLGRTRYMSTSRSLRVAHVHQRVLARHPHVYHIPMYNRTRVAAHCSKPGDGIHFTEACNCFWWSEFWEKAS